MSFSQVLPVPVAYRRCDLPLNRVTGHASASDDEDDRGTAEGNGLQASEHQEPEAHRTRLQQQEARCAAFSVAVAV